MNNIALYGVVHLPEMEAAALEVLRSGRIASGEYVARFEAGISEIVGQANVVSTIDMTSAMFLALHLAGVRQGDEVLTTAFACMSTNSAIAHCGAVPVWVDIKAHTVEVDELDLSRKITAKTKAVVLYHVAGYPGPAAQVAAICRQHAIPLIEDCDNALFASRENEPVGSHADFSVYSFYPNRQINTTEGGALVCKRAEDAVRARHLRRFGIDPLTFRAKNGEISPVSDIEEIGWAFSMNNLCAALGVAQLSTARTRVEKTRRNATNLGAAIRQFPQIRLVSVPENSEPAFWGLLIQLENRDEVLLRMKEAGVQVSGVHYRNDVYSGFGASKLAELPNTAYLQDHLLALPCGWWLSDDDLKVIAEVLCGALAAVAVAGS